MPSQETILSAQCSGDKARAQVAATLGVVEPQPPSPRHQHNTPYAAAATELFESEFGERGGTHAAECHTGSENERRAGGGTPRVIADAYGESVWGQGDERRGILPAAVVAAFTGDPPPTPTIHQPSQQHQTQFQLAPQQQLLRQQPTKPNIAPIMPAQPPLLDQAQIPADVHDFLCSHISKKSHKTYNNYNSDNQILF
jgi:hypothetical protein